MTGRIGPLMHGGDFLLFAFRCEYATIALPLLHSTFADDSRFLTEDFLCP